MPYIPFTDEQKLKAASVDLPAFLEQHGFELKRSGHEFRLESDPYITVKGSKWFDQADQRGGNPISLVRRLFSLDYPQAVSMLLDGGVGHVPVQPPVHAPREKEMKPFELPPRHSNMRRVYAYLIQQRQIPAEIISHFAKAHTLYESAEPAGDGRTVHHNAVFVGCDENGTARHAHKHGLQSCGKSYKGNVRGSDPAYSFHHLGDSGSLYVFEAPIDALSYIAMHPRDWQRHSYAALCGVAEHAMLRCLAMRPDISHVSLCLDNDARGDDAAGRLEALLQENTSVQTEVLTPVYKDWNVDLQHCLGAGPEFSEAMDSTAAFESPAYPHMAMEEL